MPQFFPHTGEIGGVSPADGTKIDPHTPVFDHNGILWLTNEETNYLGRLDPKTGKGVIPRMSILIEQIQKWKDYTQDAAQS